MDTKIDEITPSEWDLMRIVWTKGSVQTGELITLLQRKRDWSDSTIKTLLGRLVKKGLLATTKDGRKFVYHATVEETTAMDETVSELFNHLCAMKKGTTLAHLLAQTPLTKSDIAQLQTILAAKAQDAPATVPCDCLPPDPAETEADADCQC
nr:CopY/TcrY family copper transport repressor [Lacticaseibacillus hegangensis]